MARTKHWLMKAVYVALLLPVAALAQQAPTAGGAQQAPTASQRVIRTPPKDTAAATPAVTGTDAGLRKRVEQLEEQLVDLQVVIGTLESLAKSPGSSASAAYRAPSTSGDGDQARIEGIEMQIRALTQQMEQLSAEVRGAGGPKNNSAALPSPAGAMQPNAGVMPPPPTQQFGSSNVAPAAADSIGGILAAPLPATPSSASAVPAPPAATGQTAAIYPAGDDPKLAYEAAYGQMLQQDYVAAQSGFGDFLKRFPNHALVPNALYWLGETYYVQKNYADAAEAFDIVLSAHSASSKAPDSQLKKAMSLSLQGKNADACSALRQLAVKFPNAPSHVKAKADSERRRVGCT